MDTHSFDFSKKHQNFREKFAPLMDSLAEGQDPKTMVIACSDSRIDPALLLDAEPGEIFVVRNVASLVYPFKHPLSSSVGAAMEFAVNSLGVENLCILGHSDCGGMKALQSLDSVKGSDYLYDWVPILPPEETQGIDLCSCTKKALLQSHANCMTYPWIKDKVESSQLNLHVWYCDIKEGQIYTHGDGKFSPL